MKKETVKVYDCFMFFNELDLLEIRLKELNEVVDYFVIVEAPFTHSGKPKPLYFEQNKKRYEKWKDKIIHVVCPWPKISLFDKFITNIEKNFPKKWIMRLFIKLNLGRRKMEVIQRNSTLMGLKNAKNEDVVLISDVDEIPKKEVVKKIKLDLVKDNEKIFRLRQDLYYYYLNGKVTQTWESAKACTAGTLKNKIKTPDYLRNWSPLYKWLSLFKIRPLINREELIKHAGWHFSYLGGIDAVIKKIESICHFENDEKNKEQKIKEMIKKGQYFYQENSNDRISYVKIDKTFPEEIIKNKNKYSKLIMK